MTISPARDSSNPRRILALERRLHQLERQLHRLQVAEYQSPQWVRLCKTVSDENDDPPYPVEGNSVKIIFLDFEVAATVGTFVPIVTERDTPFSVVAHCPANTLPAEGEILLAIYQQPHSSDANAAYWFLPSCGKKSIQFVLDEALATTDTTVEGTIIRQFGVGSRANDPACILHNKAGDHDGLFSGPIGAIGFAEWFQHDEYIILQLECE